MKIALLGAESTGKTWLAGALARHLGDAGHDVAVVGEVLREWCAREGRTPRADEQLAIAQEQARRVLQASARIVIADTTPLMTAVYSELLFADRSLYAEALAHHAVYDLTLLMGLDLPWVADGLQRDGPQVRETVDGLVRAALSRAGLGWQMVYGQGGARLQNALFAINSVAGQQGLAGAGGRFLPQNAAWTCEKCSDPDCEHRLFTGRLGLPAG